MSSKKQRKLKTDLKYLADFIGRWIIGIGIVVQWVLEGLWTLRWLIIAAVWFLMADKLYHVNAPLAGFLCLLLALVSIVLGAVFSVKYKPDYEDHKSRASDWFEERERELKLKRI